jgi:hypothetical protein
MVIIMVKVKVIVVKVVRVTTIMAIIIVIVIIIVMTIAIFISPASILGNIFHLISHSFDNNSNPNCFSIVSIRKCLIAFCLLLLGLLNVLHFIISF